MSSSAKKQACPSNSRCVELPARIGAHATRNSAIRPNALYGSIGATNLAEIGSLDLSEAVSSAEDWQFFRDLPLGISIYGADGRLSQANQVAYKHWGGALPLCLAEYSQLRGYFSDISGEGFRAIPTHEWPLIKSFTQKSESSDQAILIADESTGKKCRALMIWASPKWNDLAFIGVTQITMEITSQIKTIQKFKNEIRAKDDFVAMLLHEIRSPLLPISSAAQTLRHVAHESPTIKRSSEIIQRQVANLNRLIEDGVELSRINKGMFTVKPGPIELAEILWQSIEQAQPMLDRKNHRLEVAVPEEAINLFADCPRLVQVFSNLLCNAARYTPPEGTIRVLARVDEKQAVVSVKDDGIGMDPSFLEKAFTPFAQGRHTGGSDEPREGLGLGLSLVRSIVEAHGGHVRALSDGVGKGSEFVVELPLAENDSLKTTTAIGSIGNSQHGDRTILVVDDNPDAADSIAMLLDAHGYAARVAVSGGEALQEAERQPPKIAIIDHTLPDINGSELAKRLRANARTRDTILIAMSGYCRQSLWPDDSQFVFDHFLIKPLDSDKLLAIVQEVMSVHPPSSNCGISKVLEQDPTPLASRRQSV